MFIALINNIFSIQPLDGETRVLGLLYMYVHVPTPLWAVTLRMFIGLEDIVLELSVISTFHTL